MVKKGELLSVFSIGAAGYSLLEILWRGNTHWTMTLAGGICFAPACIRSHVCPPAASCAAVSSVLSTYDQE